MFGIDLRALVELEDRLGILFYAAMAAALLSTLMGSPGWGFLLLLLGSCALVVRTALEVSGKDRSGRA